MPTTDEKDWAEVARQWLNRPITLALVLEVDSRTQEVLAWRTETLENVAALVDGLKLTTPNRQEDAA
ncbi:MAG TPA: hypothetical protein ENJ54_03200 [Chloroflexi bacterium]|nr:hypothetical protein [Chloroflexota bacterium]